MKIGFLGNTNNYPFTLARACRRAGHDVRVVVDEQNALSRPEGKYPEEIRGYGSWITHISPIAPIDVVLAGRNVRAARSALADCDLLVLNDCGPAVFADCPLRKFVIITGADLESYASYEYAQQVKFEHGNVVVRAMGTLVKHAVYHRFVAAQRKGIASAELVEYAFPGMLPRGDALLAELGITPEKRCWFMLTDPDLIAATPLPNNSPLRVFAIARLNWCEPFPVGIDHLLDNKRTDLMLEGLADYLAIPGRELDIRLVKKGLHVQQTMEYAQELGIGGNITWLAEMSQTEFYRELSLADIVMDHFGQGVIGLGVRDALAAGRPVIVNEPTRSFERFLGEDIPILRAGTREEICAQLTALCSSASLREQIAREARRFAVKYCNPNRAVNAVVGKFSSPHN